MGFKFLSEIPASVSELNLAHNGLSASMLEPLFSNLPESIRTLELTAFAFYDISGDDVAKILYTVPKSVATLKIKKAHFQKVYDADKNVANLPFSPAEMIHHE